MSYLVICSVAFLASGLTFFSGFGLGTLLLPAFALFFPVDVHMPTLRIRHDPVLVRKAVVKVPVS